MRLSLAALAACAITAQAFKDTSPFLLFSSTHSPALVKDGVESVQSSERVLKSTKEFLSSCPSDVYYLIHQPSIRSSDLQRSTLPSLSIAIDDPGVESKYLVPDVRSLGSDVKHELATYLQERCGETTVLSRDDTIPTTESLGSQILEGRKQAKKVIVLQTMEELVTGPEGGERQATLDRINRSLDAQFSTISDDFSYTVVWTSSPPSTSVTDVEDYVVEFDGLPRMELKRDLGDDSPVKEPARSVDPRPLFEKYQFLTPGIFMGLVASLLLVAILSVGLSAISSLQVSYSAFDKDMGPAAQKKQL